MDLKQIEQNYQSDMTCLHHKSVIHTKCEKCGDMRELDEFDLNANFSYLEWIITILSKNILEYQETIMNLKKSFMLLMKQ